MSAHLPPMCPGSNSRTRRHMWVEFVIGSLLCSERFSPGTINCCTPGVILHAYHTITAISLQQHFPPSPRWLLWRDLTVIDSCSFLLYILMKNKLKKIYFKSNLKSTFNRTFLKFQQQTNQRPVAEPHKTIITSRSLPSQRTRSLFMAGAVNTCCIGFF